MKTVYCMEDDPSELEGVDRWYVQCPVYPDCCPKCDEALKGRCWAPEHFVRNLHHSGARPYGGFMVRNHNEAVALVEYLNEGAP